MVKHHIGNRGAEPLTNHRNRAPDTFGARFASVTRDGDSEGQTSEAWEHNDNGAHRLDGNPAPVTITLSMSSFRFHARAPGSACDSAGEMNGHSVPQGHGCDAALAF